MMYSRSIVYEPWTQSLLSLRESSGLPVMRVDADRRFLIQEYRSAGRLSQCYPGASFVGVTGDIHLLLNCYYFDAQYYSTKVLLHTMTAAGRIRREVVFNGYSASVVQDQSAGGVRGQTAVLCCHKRQSTESANIGIYAQWHQRV